MEVPLPIIGRSFHGFFCGSSEIAFLIISKFSIAIITFLRYTGSVKVEEKQS